MIHPNNTRNGVYYFRFGGRSYTTVSRVSPSSIICSISSADFSGHAIFSCRFAFVFDSAWKLCRFLFLLLWGGSLTFVPFFIAEPCRAIGNTMPDSQKKKTTGRTNTIGSRETPQLDNREGKIPHRDTHVLDMIILSLRVLEILHGILKLLGQRLAHIALDAFLGGVCRLLRVQLLQSLLRFFHARVSFDVSVGGRANSIFGGRV